MNTLFSFLLSGGPVALLAAVVAVPVYYAIYRNSADSPRPSLLARYLLACLGVGAVAYGAGAVIGIFVICSLLGAGNLSGLAGIFGVGPLLCATAVFGYAHRWARRMRRAAHQFGGDAADTHRDA